MARAARARTPFLLPTTPAFVRLQARRRGGLGGLCFAGRRLAYGELATAIDELADWLTRRGIGAGHHVGVIAGNDPAMVAMTYALWGLGAVTVPIAIRSTVEEAAHLLQHSRAAAVICDAARAPLGGEAAAAAGVPAYACEADLPLRPRVLRRKPLRVASPASPSPEQLAVIAYTSGTTGKPKGAMISHGNLLWSSQACGQARGDRAEGVGACLSPLTHTPVFVSHLLCRILTGSTAVLVEKFDVASVLEQVERFGVTDLPLIGGMVFDVVSSQARIADAARDSVEKVSVGGAATPMDAKRALAGIFARAEVIEAYGQSESTDGVAMARGTSVFDHEGTVGRANPFVVVAIRRADGSLAADGEEGEIVIGGPTVMQGYLRDPAATAEAIRDGWLHTGDLGRRNPEGYFFVTGRVKALIITGGENVSPVEIEDVLRQHPHVADVAVIGTPHPKWGEQVTAVIVARDGVRDVEALAEFAGGRLAGFKRPRRWEFVDALPRNAANKVQTHVLKQRFN
jgi:acyl-CoA synthetase (AMP-forming)/AMP-acid ligase II